MVGVVKKLIEDNPLFHDKLQYPSFEKSRLRTLIDQSLNWQHSLCGNIKEAPDIKTLFHDHSCGPFAFNKSPVTKPLKRSLPEADAENVFKRSRFYGVSDEVNNRLPNNLPITFLSHNAHMLYASEELPKILIANLNQGSAVMSIDFHPQHQSLLLVGTSIGDITLWEVGSKRRLLSRSFKIWDVAACSATLQVSLVHASTASVNRVIWSPNGCFLGVAYSMHIVHVYSYCGKIAAHVGNVTDLAFFDLKKQLCIRSCGEDKIVKVWDASTGEKLYTFEGHMAPVFSLYPHMKENTPNLMGKSRHGCIMRGIQ